MDAERWEHVQALFHRALALPEPQQRSFLKAACAGDTGLQAEVEALLQEDARGTSPLDTDLGRVAYEMLDGPLPMLRAIGPYRLLSVLGRGGMGVVYLAERDDLGHRVAIKVLRDAGLSPARRERFTREQQTLAHLVHPSIARLYDADVLPDGTPYFVMEYVRGAPLTAYCDTHRCSLEERLRLFRAVCEAVQFAHRQAVVHRDLKPSNILVAGDASGGPPSVKLLDFGIARPLDDRSLPAAQTQTGLRLMTPAYAAPEQLRGEPVGIYSDVYALGVILYELLAGRHPFDLSGLTPGQAELRMLEQEPPRPSLAVASTSGAAAAPAPFSAGRHAWADLDVLCLTAMHKDPQRRYPTVEALMRDLDHYLGGEPLEARPDALGYRLGKFLRRHHRPAAAAALMLALVVSLIGFYTARLTSARDEALAEAARTQRIQRFMLQLFEGDEAAGPSDTLRVVTLLERGAREARLFDGEPEIQAELFETLGTLYRQMGHLDRADSLLQAALDGRRTRLGSDHPSVARSLIALGLLRVDQAVLDEADRLIREGLQASRRSLAPEHPAQTEAVLAFGRVLQARGDYDAAIEVFEEVVRFLAARSPASVELSESLSELANTHFYAGRYATSDSLNRIVLAMDRQLYGRRHPSVASTLVNLGATRFQLGYYDEAERLYRQALEMYIPYYGPEHHVTASNMVMLGQTVAYQERYAEALDLLVPALRVRERVFGPDHPRVASTLNELGTVALQQGDLAAAEAYFARMTDIYRKAYDDRHYLIGIGLSNLASVYRQREQLDRAEQLQREAITYFATTLSEEHYQTAVARLKLGRLLVLQNRHAEAEVHLLAGHSILRAQVNPSVHWIRDASRDLAAVYDALGDAEKARAFRAALAEAGP